jgi:hypothetical protein
MTIKIKIVITMFINDYQCYGLPFPSPGNVSEYFVNYLMKSKPDDERVIRFADYLVDVIISEEAQYSPEIWTQASAEPTLTINACEFFHSTLIPDFIQLIQIFSCS